MTNTTSSSSEELTEIKALEQNKRRVLRLSFFQTFMVVIPVVVPFMGSKGLDMAAILTLQAIFAAVIVVCEVPRVIWPTYWVANRHWFWVACSTA